MTFQHAIEALEKGYRGIKLNWSNFVRRRKNDQLMLTESRVSLKKTGVSRGDRRTIKV